MIRQVMSQVNIEPKFHDVQSKFRCIISFKINERLCNIAIEFNRVAGYWSHKIKNEIKNEKQRATTKWSCISFCCFTNGTMGNLSLVHPRSMLLTGKMRNCMHQVYKWYKGWHPWCLIQEMKTFFLFLVLCIVQHIPRIIKGLCLDISFMVSERLKNMYSDRDTHKVRMYSIEHTPSS